LVVGVRDGQLYLRSRSLELHVRPTARHMLNHHGAPPICQFLEELAQQGAPSLSGFDWGPAHSLPYLPRVTYGRTILELARWLVPSASTSPVGGLSSFRSSGPTYRSGANSGTYRREFSPQRQTTGYSSTSTTPTTSNSYTVKLATGLARVVLQEALPDIQDAWLPGRGGTYLSEIVVSLDASRVGRLIRSRLCTRLPNPLRQVVPYGRSFAIGSNRLAATGCSPSSTPLRPRQRATETASRRFSERG
jgi:hypothetical protein